MAALFATASYAQGRENIGMGVLNPKLTGTRPGYSPDQVKYWAPNDPSYVNSDLFEQQMVDLHNRYRAEHGVYPVAWDPKLVETAQQLVDTCVYGHSVGYILHASLVSMLHRERNLEANETHAIISRLEPRTSPVHTAKTSTSATQT